MKNTFFLVLSLVVFSAFVSSCGSTDGGTTPSTNYTPTPVHFKQSEIAYYQLNIVDTADASGNNLDRIIPDPDNPMMVEELVADTNVSFSGGIRATKTILASNPPDTNFYYQDKDGNLFRYNYGFSKLNNYSFLVLALGKTVDVGWVLFAKPGAPAGTSWVAKKDSMLSAQYGKLYLDDNATALADTTFKISDGQNFVDVKTTHVRHIVNGHTGGNEISGVIVVDFYFSPELGLTIRDLFHSSKLSGLNLKTRGSEKLMVSYKP